MFFDKKPKQTKKKRPTDLGTDAARAAGRSVGRRLFLYFVGFRIKTYILHIFIIKHIYLILKHAYFYMFLLVIGCWLLVIGYWL